MLPSAPRPRDRRGAARGGEGEDRRAGYGEDVPYAHGRDECAQKRKREDDAKVAEEVLLLELIPRVEDDGREQQVEKEGMFEHLLHQLCSVRAHSACQLNGLGLAARWTRTATHQHLPDQVARTESYDQPDDHSRKDRHDRLVYRADPLHLQVVRGAERPDEEDT